jgi:hypothetical protein
MICEKNIEPRRAAWGRYVRRAVMPALVAAMAALPGCSDAVRGGDGSSFLTITTLEGGAGTAGTLGAVLNSDVLNVDPTTQKQSIAADRGQVAFQLQMKDVTGAGPSANNAITLTQYHVEYVRSDGHNVQGVDVPFAFDGAVTITISDSGSTGFTLVRIQAKQEAPLAALAFGGGANTISTVARVTFYGHDQTGRGVSATGNIEVNFSDFAG